MLASLAGILAALAGCSSEDFDAEQKPDEGAELDGVPPAQPPSLESQAILAMDPTSHYAALTQGVATVDGSTGAVSPLVLSSPHAFPVLVDESKRVFAAAALSGLGKVLAYGHENYMTATVKSGAATKLVLNAIAWMSSKPNPVIGVDSALTTLKSALTAAGYQTVTVTPSQLGTVQIYVNRTYTKYTDAEMTSIRQFVQNGGGLIVGGQAWSFAGDVQEYPGNKMLAGTGITIAKASDISAGIDTVSATPPSMLLNATVALDKMTDHVTNVAKMTAEDLESAASSVERAASFLPLSVRGFYDSVDTFLAASPPPVITAAAPFTPEGNPVGRVGLRLQHRYTQELPATALTAHASAADFPFAVPAQATRETFNVTINGTYAGRDARYAASGAGVPVWRGTGTYAAPGEVVTVTVPASFVNQGLSVQIGSHTDQLWKKTPWKRFPAIVRSYPVSAAQISVASAFGGTIYITVPGGKSLGSVPVTISGAVRAPYYVHNMTTLQEWQTIRNDPAPWAEIESDKMILMLPSSYIRNLSDPVALMNQWDLVMDAQADLSSIPHERVRAERYLIDRDISAGYMHSGYPIMAPTVEAADLVNLTKLLAGKWGYWHEVGHNHQWQPWGLQGTGESTVNLFSIYVAEVLLNTPRGQAHSALTPTARAQRLQTYIAGGRKYATWGSDAWLPLEMYMQLQEGFGWAPYKSVFADYNALTSAQSPSTDQARVDQWVLRFSQKVGKNLGPFFLSWGLPVSQSILDAIAALPPWTENPMQ